MINFRTDTFFNASSFDLTVIHGNAIQTNLACFNPKSMRLFPRDGKTDPPPRHFGPPSEFMFFMHWDQSSGGSKTPQHFGSFI